MGRNRKKNKHLPLRVYQRRGKLYYVKPGTEEWIPLPDGLKTWAAIVQSADGTETMSALWGKYDLDELCKKAKKTQKNRRQEWKMLEPVFGEMTPRDVESHHAWNYWKKRGEIEQAKKEIRCLSVLLTYGKRTGAFSHENPCFGLQLPESPPRRHYVTDEAFLFVRERAQPMVGYAMDISYIAGIDEGTILKLERRHLTDDGIKFVRSKNEHREEAIEQIIEWNDELQLVISALLKQKPQVRRALICTRQGQPYTPDGFQSQWQRLMRKCKQAGFKDHFHFHDIRAKSASEADTDQEAADRLGHADVKLTSRIYRRLPKRAKALTIKLKSGI